MPKGRPGRPVTPFALTSDQEAQLRGVVNVTPLSSGLTLRARIGCAAGISNKAVAEKLGMSPLTVGKWRKRFTEDRDATPFIWAAAADLENVQRLRISGTELDRGERNLPPNRQSARAPGKVL